MDKKNDLVDIWLVENWKKIRSNHSHFPNINSIEDEYFKSEVSSLRKSILERSNDLQKEFRSRFETESLLLELFLLENLYLFLILDSHFGVDPVNPSSDKINIDSNSFQVLRTVAILLHQLSNNQTAFYKLISGGFNFQANLIFRNTIETGSIITACLIDHNFHDNYKNLWLIESEEERNKQWYKFLRPKHIDTVIAKGYEKTKRSTDDWNTILEIRKSLYSDSSDFVHTDFLTSVNSSYSEKQDNEGVELNLLGRIDTNTKSTLDRTLMYLRLLVYDVKLFMITEHGLTFDKFGESGLSVVFASKINDELFKSFYMKKSI